MITYVDFQEDQFNGTTTAAVTLIENGNTTTLTVSAALKHPNHDVQQAAHEARNFNKDLANVPSTKPEQPYFYDTARTTLNEAAHHAYSARKL